MWPSAVNISWNKSIHARNVLLFDKRASSPVSSSYVAIFMNDFEYYFSATYFTASGDDSNGSGGSSARVMISMGGKKEGITWRNCFCYPMHQQNTNTLQSWVAVFRFLHSTNGWYWLLVLLKFSFHQQYQACLFVLM